MKNLICKIQGLAFCVLILIFTFSAISYAQPVPSQELINKANQYDGQTVAYAGEVIGDIMPRKDYAWINVNDGQNAIGVWIKYDLAKDIFYTGNYKYIGDIVEVSGVFHRACPEHGGDLDIHAQALRKISPGRPTPEKLNLSKRNYASVLLIILGLVWILTFLKRR